MHLKQSAVRRAEMKRLITTFSRYVALALPMLMIYSSPAIAEYDFQVVNFPGSVFTNLFGINNAGKAVGNADDGVSGFSYMYDMKSGEYTTISDEIGVLEISNSGVIVGDVDGVCAIRDKNGNITTFAPPTFSLDPDNSFCQARGVNSNGKVSGFEVDAIGGFIGFIYDSKHGTYEEFLPSLQTIAHAINAQGQNVGSIILFEDEAYPGSPFGRYGYLRQTDGTFKYFAISQADPGQSTARGLSESGLITGFYLDTDTFEFKGYVTTLSSGTEFEEITLTDDQVVHRTPCDPNVPPPPSGYDLFTDVFTSQIRNDGVVVGSCSDYYFNETTGDFIFGINNFGFIATPIK